MLEIRLNFILFIQQRINPFQQTPKLNWSYSDDMWLYILPNRSVLYFSSWKINLDVEELLQYVYEERKEIILY